MSTPDEQTMYEIGIATINEACRQGDKISATLKAAGFQPDAVTMLALLSIATVNSHGRNISKEEWMRTVNSVYEVLTNRLKKRSAAADLG